MKLSTRFLSVAASTFLLTATTSTLPRSIGFIHRAEAQSVEQNQADQLFNEGMQFFDEGSAESYQLAIAKWQQALPLYEQQNNQAQAAETNLAIGFVSSNLGFKQEALEFFNQALLLYRVIEDSSLEAMTLSNIGAIYDDLGKKQQAFDFYQQALSLNRALGDRAGEARTLNNIGAVYDDLGEKQQALDFYQQALSIVRALGDRGGEATTLNNLGKVYDDLGEKQQALDFYNQALPLRRAVGDRGGEATTLSNIGVVYSALGEKQQALDYYQQALLIKRAVGDRGGEASILNNMGLVYSDLGEKQQALDFYNQALPLFRAVGNRASEATTLGNIADLEKDRGNLQAALSPMQQSIEILEDLRTKVDSKELRQTYFSTVQDYYQFYIDLLMELHHQNPSQGYDKQAFNVSEKSRARTLLELLTEAKIDLKEGIDPKLKEQEQTLSQQLDQTEQQRLTIYQNNNSTNAEKSEINQTLDLLTQQFQKLQEEIRRNSPKYAAFKYPQPVTTEQIQNKILDDDTVLLQYALGTEKSYLWVVTKDSFNSYELPKNTELTELINNVRSQITDTSKEDFPPPIKQTFAQKRIVAIQQLSQTILQPAASLLNKKRILIVPDGALYTLPFSVLSTSSDSYEPLATHHEIINLPSSSTLDILRQNNSAKIPDNPSLAIFADPVFKANDCRLTNTADCDQERLRASRNRAAREFNNVDFSPLPGTYSEAENILNLFPTKTNIKSAFGFSATRDRIIGNQLEKYDLIHFATHGFFNEEKPEQSGLVFSLVDEKGQPQNGFLRLDSIFNMKLNADLVVMSACQTGLGEDIKGEGMVGLSRGFMYAGASHLLMSLWSVDDAATAEFMTRFYRLLLQDKLTPAAALQETQRQMREETQWSHPYYWSAFILQGDWH